jgi:hypothetical protein
MRALHLDTVAGVPLFGGTDNHHRGIPAARGDPDGDGDDDDAGGSSSHVTERLEEPKGWIARPITHDAARRCHFHDALDTLLRRAFDRHTWSIEYRCVVY